MKLYAIEIPNQNGHMEVGMSAKDISDLHDKLTTFYNDNYKEIEEGKDEDAEGREVAEQERNIDHANDMKI